MPIKKQNCEELILKRQGRLRKAVSRFTIGLVFLNLLWRTVRYALGFPLWGDEAFVAINFVGRGFADVLSPLEYGQLAPLGFLWAEVASARIFGLSEWALRLVPYLTGILSMGLFWRFTRQVLDPRTALLAVAVFGSAYYPVRHGAEIKPYASDLLVSLTLISLGWAMLEESRPTWRWVALIFFAPVAVWLSYPAVFVAGSVGMLLAHRVLRSPGPKALAASLAYILFVAASFVAMYTLFGQVQAKAAAWITEIAMWQPAFPPVGQPWRLPLWFLDIHTGNMLAYPVGGRRGGSSLTFLLVVIGSVVTWRSRRQLLILLLGPLPLTFLAAAMHRYPYGSSARVSLYMAPAFCLLAAVGLVAALKVSLPRRSVPSGIRVAAIVMTVIAIVGISNDILHPYKTISDEDNRRTIRLLVERTQPGDRWVVFNALTDLPYAPNIVRWGGPAARFRFYLTRLAPVPIQWAPAPTEVIGVDGSRIWLIAYNDERVPFQKNLLPPYLQALTERLGQPRRYTFPLGDREAINLYEFLPREPVHRDMDRLVTS